MSDTTDTRHDDPAMCRPAATAPRSGVVRRIFIGSDGLRAGWSLVIFLVVFSLLSAGLSVISPDPNASDQRQVLQADRAIFGESAVFIILFVATMVMALIERRPFGRYGLAAPRALPDAAVGAAWGVVMLSVLVAVLWLSGALVFDRVTLGIEPAIAFGLKWLIAFLLVGLLEEFLFRGFIQFTLARGITGIVRAIAPRQTKAATIGFWIAAILLSAGLFAFAHTGNKGETALGLVGVAAAGITFVSSLWRTGTLWWAIGFHAAWNWAQSFLYGVSDSGTPAAGHLLDTHAAGPVLLSGGSVGPEGSILLVPTMLLTCYVIHRTLPKRAVLPLGARVTLPRWSEARTAQRQDPSPPKD